MNIAIVTGSAGLIGSEAVSFFSGKFDLVIGIDNNLRAYFFGAEASTRWNQKNIEQTIDNYRHFDIDIREFKDIEKIFKEYTKDIRLVLHTAAQPSHDWAAKEPLTDFSVNATGTLNMLECTRLHSPDATFIFTSTNKVYGDRPNKLPLEELDTRFEIIKDHPYYTNGIDENMSIDQSKHSLYGASKVAGDVLVQEYGRYFGMKSAAFRGGCLSGPNHSGAQLHGFLAYLMKCGINGDPYTIFGYKGKQVRDILHSWDLVNMFWHFYQNPRCGEVYNTGGGRHSNCSMIEAISLVEDVTGNKMNYSLSDTNRIGDHIWWISDVSKFKNHYPSWSWKYSLRDIAMQLHTGISKRQALQI